MAQANYRQVELAIANRENFRGNSCWGMWIDGTYKVVSYHTLIAKDDGVVKWLNSDYYSNTTSRLQNIVRRVWSL